MPELPEVETVVQGLKKSLLGKTFAKPLLRRKTLRTPIPADLARRIAAQKIKALRRRAKYILIDLENGDTLIIHLGMSGSLVIEKDNTHPFQKHDHVVLYTTDGQRVIFNDPRRFGLVGIAKTTGLETHKFFSHLGPEPLEPGFTAQYLLEKFKRKTTAVKVAIMDQVLVVGVGNIYAAEALFYAGVSPVRPAGSLDLEDCKKLVAEIRKVLKAAIKSGGSSLRDYVQADGELGYFQHRFSVYGKYKEKCKGCSCDLLKTGGIARITQGGRSTFFCPQKQK